MFNYNRLPSRFTNTRIKKDHHLLSAAKHLLLLLGVLLGDVEQEVADTPRVTPLVIVPGDQLDEVLVQLDTGAGVEDGGSRMADEIGGDDSFLSVLDDALVRPLGSSLDGSLDLIVGSLLLKADDKINDRDIDGGDTEGKAGKLAVEGRNDLSDSLGGTGGRRDDIVADGTTTTPVLVGRAVDGLLSGSGRMDSGHQTLDDTEFVVDNLGEGGQAVGCAGSVGDDGVLGIVLVQVDTTNEHWGVSGRSGDDDLLGATLQMSTGLFGGSEDTSGLDNVISIDGAPRDVTGISLRENADGLALDDKFTILNLDGSIESSVDRVVLEHVNHVLKIDEGVVNSDNLDVSENKSITEDDAANTTETVDPNVDLAHRCSGSFLLEESRED